MFKHIKPPLTAAELKEADKLLALGWEPGWIDRRILAQTREPARKTQPKVTRGEGSGTFCPGITISGDLWRKKENRHYWDDVRILTVLEFVGCSETGHSQFRCECRCGEFITARSTDLVGGTKRKCSQTCTWNRPRVRFTFGTIYDGASSTKFGRG